MVVFSRCPNPDTTPSYQRVMTILACFMVRGEIPVKCLGTTMLCFLCNSFKIQRCLKVGFRGITWENEGHFRGKTLSCPSPDPYRGGGLGQRISR